ncbi:hypothetical protein AMECASPLE_005083 [Ameca splendens]|uniref:Uncharacterized protein n=1 Tax=Ameca splendens TaxID=208324 RepID=A0ABV0YYF3_9TELE
MAYVQYKQVNQRWVKTMNKRVMQHYHAIFMFENQGLCVIVGYFVAGPKADKLGGSRVGSKTRPLFPEFAHIQISRAQESSKTAGTRSGAGRVSKDTTKDITPRGTKGKRDLNRDEGEHETIGQVIRKTGNR